MIGIAEECVPDLALLVVDVLGHIPCEHVTITLFVQTLFPSLISSRAAGIGGGGDKRHRRCRHRKTITPGHSASV